MEQIREWFGRPLWEMEPRDGDQYFGGLLRGAALSTRAGRAQALMTYFAFLELRYKVELSELTGRMIQWPLSTR